MEKFILSNPFKLQSGKEITEFSLRFDELSVADFRQICKFEAQITNAQSVSMMDAVNDRQLKFEFQLASGFLAAMKGTDGLKEDDFTRLSMQDSLALAKVASFFWLDMGFGQSKTSEVSTAPSEDSPSTSTPTSSD